MCAFCYGMRSSLWRMVKQRRYIQTLPSRANETSIESDPLKKTETLRPRDPIKVVETLNESDS